MFEDRSQQLLIHFWNGQFCSFNLLLEGESKSKGETVWHRKFF